jgi:coenzyme F420 biosynthesis associated uncharacterized protein
MPSDGPIDWVIAERVAIRVAGQEPLARSYLSHSLPADLTELTPLAEDLVAQTTGLRSLGGPAHAVVVDRSEWIQANLDSFRRILAPLLDKMAERGTMRGPARSATRAVAGTEVGALLGWMSRRVLGQYDLLVADGAPDDSAPVPAKGDTVYLVGPNVLGIEKKWGFPPREFRLWLALHEVTHRAQFTGVPWMRDHYLGLVRESVDAVDPDPKQLVDTLRSAVSSIRRDGLRAFDDGGIAGVLANPRQRDVLDRIGGLMTLLEGHGDVTMDRAAVGHVPGAERFGRVLRERRQNGSPITKVVMKLTGIEAKLNQYAHGESFLAAVEGVDPGLVARFWEDPANLPTLEEIKAPHRWVARMGTPDRVA